MKNILKSWFFFTTLLLFLLAAALTLPQFMDMLFGDTAFQLSEAVHQMESNVSDVWAQLQP